ncbi:MAG: L-rhamnose mutarotase [Bacteroidales bacterium]|jgi:L-rhamnose mutarotase|nr:L-rhamnose mutarotase [Bacteroidales bacterium]
MSENHTSKSGYPCKKYPVPVKRYCQTLSLKDDPELVQEYIKRHDRFHHWPEIARGIKEVGILEMELYLSGTTLCMIVETALDFDWDTAFSILATLPRQQEWEDYMSIFQEARAGAASSEKWKLMERIFYLYE